MSTNGRTSEEETEITRVKSEIEQLRDQNASHKHECKELKQMIKNHNVVLKEFSKSYETQKSSFETLEAELMVLIILTTSTIFLGSSLTFHIS